MNRIATLPRPATMPEESVKPFLLDEQAAHLLRRAHQRASAIFLNLLGEHQLTPTQFFALARLYEVGKLSQNRLGRLAAMDPATIQGVIQRLAERGYIERMPDPLDRRRMVLRLSEAGRAIVAGLLEGAHRVDAEVMAPLSAEERTTFLQLLRRIT